MSSDLEEVFIYNRYRGIQMGSFEVLSKNNLRDLHEDNNSIEIVNSKTNRNISIQ